MLNQFKLTALSLAILAIVGCASGGGAGNVVSTGTPPPSGGGTTTPTDTRIAFQSFTQSYNDKYGATSVVYEMAPLTTTGLPAPTEKYKVTDYGFLRIRVEGSHNGSDEGPESNNPGAWQPDGYWFEADLNGDNHKDLYFIGHYEGAIDWMPGASLLAFINDGNGHYRLAPEIFENNVFPCIAGDGPLNNKTDPNDKCGFQNSNNFPIVQDFNGDGITDVFTVGSLFLSENGVIKNVSHENLPDIFFQDHIGPLFSHKTASGDIDNDNDVDIFLPVYKNTKFGYKLDGSLDACSGCNQIVPWMMLVNDGRGKFSLNTNFSTPADVNIAGNWERIWATSAAVNDFNNDGHGDVAVGWESPGLASAYGWLENSAGNVYLNNGFNDWRTDPINLPANWYGSNGIAVDMKSFDFNSDGHNDLVIFTSRHTPYYEGNVIQFMLNDGTGNFSDVTQTFNPSYSKYELGSGTSWKNGGGLIHIIDFDHDGDLDIVSTNGRSYVLLNENGSFKLYDDFPMWDNGDGGNLWPVEIDGKYWYDFISSKSTTVDSDTGYVDFYQVLDPPAGLDKLLYMDMFTKPNAYREMAVNANNLYSDLFYNARNNTYNDKLIYSKGKGTDQLGYVKKLGDVSVSYLSNRGSNQHSEYNSDSIGAFVQHNNFYAGVGLNFAEFDNAVNTAMFGQGRSVVDAKTVGVEVGYNYAWNNFTFTGALRHNNTKVDQFTDYNDLLPLTIAKQNFTSNMAIAEVEYNKDIQLSDSLVWFVGADVEHIRYLSNPSHSTNFSQGGNFISTNEREYNLKNTFISVSTGLVVNGKLGVTFSATDNSGFRTYTVSVGTRF